MVQRCIQCVTNCKVNGDLIQIVLQDDETENDVKDVGS